MRVLGSQFIHMMRMGLSVVWMLALVLTASHTAATEWKEGRVAQVHDGDTVTVVVNRNKLKVRLWQIDAPELAQPYGDESKQYLRQLLEGQRVRLEITAQDRYGRNVARVWRGDVDVNLQQVQAGMAWVYRDYAHDVHYVQEEQRSQQANEGLWQDPHPQAPWEWRRENKGNSSNRESREYESLFKLLKKSFQLLRLF
jgi:micrococcal nuclease